jgi:hypothetical protein
MPTDRKTPLEAAHEWLPAWGHEDCQLKPALAALIKSREREAVESARPEIQQLLSARIEQLRTWLLVFLDSVEDDPRACQFFDLRLLKEVKRSVSRRLEEGAAGKKPSEVASPPVASCHLAPEAEAPDA